MTSREQLFKIIDEEIKKFTVQNKITEKGYKAIFTKMIGQNCKN